MSLNESMIKNAVLTGLGNLAVSRHIGGAPHSHRSKDAAKPACASHLVTVAALSQIGREFLFKRKSEKTGLTYLNPLFAMTYLFNYKPELAAAKTKGPDNYRSPTPTENPQSWPAIVEKANRPSYPQHEP